MPSVAPRSRLKSTHGDGTEQGVVLDASALLAYLHNETGADRVRDALAGVPCMSVVNYAEVLSRLARNGQPPVRVDALLRQRGLIGGIIDLITPSEDDAVEIARLTTMAAARVLSLGDRSCLATAYRLGLPVLTADRAWSAIGSEVVVRLIRE